MTPTGTQDESPVVAGSGTETLSGDTRSMVLSLVLSTSTRERRGRPRRKSNTWNKIGVLTEFL